MVLAASGAAVALPYVTDLDLHLFRFAALALAGGLLVIASAFRGSAEWERGQVVLVQLSEPLQVDGGLSYFAKFTWDGRSLVRPVLCPSGEKLAQVSHDGRVGPAVLVTRSSQKRPLLLTCELLDHSLSPAWLPVEDLPVGAPRRT